MININLKFLNIYSLLSFSELNNGFEIEVFPLQFFRVKERFERIVGTYGICLFSCKLYKIYIKIKILSL